MFDEENKNSDLFNFNGMFYQLGDGCCRLDYKGRIAVKTSTGYKVYDLATRKLINVASFCFDVGAEMFYVIPTNEVHPGENIIHKGRPRCVISATENEIVAINYENATQEVIIPERHVFMGNVYFVGKIVSLMSGMFNFNNGGNGFEQMLQFRIISQMFNGGEDETENEDQIINGKRKKKRGMFGGGFGQMMSLMAMSNMFGNNANNNGGIFGNMFGGLFGNKTNNVTQPAPVTVAAPAAKKRKPRKQNPVTTPAAAPTVIVETANEDEEEVK